MSSRRILLAVALALMALPVGLAVDGPGDVPSTFAFENLRQGDTYRYDLVVESSRLGWADVYEDAYVVHVEQAQPRTLMDGTVREVVDVRSETLYPDLFVPNATVAEQDPPRQPEDRASSALLRFVQQDDGWALAETHATSVGDHVTTYPVVVGGDDPPLGYRSEPPRRVWSNISTLGELSTSIPRTGGDATYQHIHPWLYAAMGIFDLPGRGNYLETVHQADDAYAIVQAHTPPSSSRTPEQLPGCQLGLGDAYWNIHDASIADDHTRNLSYQMTTRYVHRFDHALSTELACQLHITDPVRDTVVEDQALILRLSEVERGQGPPFEPSGGERIDPTQLPARGPQGTGPTPGVPVDTDEAPWPHTLSDAWAALQRSDAPLQPEVRASLENGTAHIVYASLSASETVDRLGPAAPSGVAEPVYQTLPDEVSPRSEAERTTPHNLTWIIGVAGWQWLDQIIVDWPGVEDGPTVEIGNEAHQLFGRLERPNLSLTEQAMEWATLVRSWEDTTGRDAYDALLAGDLRVSYRAATGPQGPNGTTHPTVNLDGHTYLASNGHLYRHEHRDQQDAPATPLFGARTAAAQETEPTPARVVSDAGTWPLVGLGAGLAVLLFALAFDPHRWGIASLYSKIARSSVLDHRRRDEIASFLEANPGASTRDVQRHLRCGYTTAVHHLRLMGDHGLVRSVKGPRERYHFMAEAGALDTEEAIARRNPTAAAFLDAVRHDPGIVQKDLAEGLGITAKAVRWHAERLMEAGLVERRRQGRTLAYVPRGDPTGAGEPTPGAPKRIKT